MSKKTEKFCQATGEILTVDAVPEVRRPWARVRTRTVLDPVSKTHQSFRDACDVNNIVARYERTGELPPARHNPTYGDVVALQGDLTDKVNRSREVISSTTDFLAGRQRKAVVSGSKSVVVPPVDSSVVVPPAPAVTPPATM